MIAIIGFSITVITVLGTKKASNQVAEAVDEIRDKVFTVDAIAELTSVIETLEDLKRSYRAKEWDLISFKLSRLTRILISITPSVPKLKVSPKRKLQAAIVHFRAMDEQIEKVIQDKTKEPSILQTNKVISKQIEELTELLTIIKNTF